MSTHSAPWENRLLDWAYQGLQHELARECPQADGVLLAQAYDCCRAITRKNSRTFYLASGFLSPSKRRAMRALYAFCRASDDIVDHPSPSPQADLEAWHQEAIADCPPSNRLIALAWMDAQAAYSIPSLYADQLIAGLSQDLVRTRYATFEELTTYCYGVASTVGLMAMHIIGFSGPQAIPYAVRLGVALQLTNILRDVAEDWASGRLYLPLEELTEFGLSVDDIARGQVDDRWRRFMRFQIDRVRTLYGQALPGVSRLRPDGRFAISAAAELYCAILDDIEVHDMDVFHRRAHVSTQGKLLLLPGIWWRSYVTGYEEGNGTP